MNDLKMKDLTGVGLIFPLELDDTGKPKSDFGFPLLLSDLKIFITWFIGTRFFLGNYGTNISRTLQNPNDDITKDLIRFDIAERLPYWDQRLEVIAVDVIRPEHNEVEIKITIRLKGTSIEEVFKFPINTLT